MKRYMIATLIGCLAVLVGCGVSSKSSSTNSSGGADNLQSGAWEFTGTTDTNGYSWIIESVITPQGQQFSAPSNELLFVVHTDINSTSNYTSGGICDFVQGPDSVSGSVNGSSVTLAFSDPLDSYTGTGTITNGTSVSGTYTGSSSSDCPYTGSFTGNAITQPLSGTFAGTLSFWNGAVDNVTVTLSQSSSQGLTMTGTSTGTDNGSVTMSGVAIANGMQVQGTIGTDAFSVWGLYLPATKEIVVSETSVNRGQTIGTLTLQNSMTNNMTGLWQGSISSTNQFDLNITQTGNTIGGTFITVPNSGCQGTFPLTGTVSGSGFEIFTNNNGTINQWLFTGSYSGSTMTGTFTNQSSGNHAPCLSGPFTATLSQ
jgi:hypothetical protein